MGPASEYVSRPQVPFEESSVTNSSRENNEPSVALLKPIVDAKPGELLLLGASMLWIFSALTAYYIIKPIRSTVLQTLIGVDNKASALLATTVFVGLFAYGYGKVVPRVRRRTLVVGTFVGFIACVLAFAAALPSGKNMEGGSAALGYVFFVWVSTFNLMVVSQFWSVASEAWTKEQGVRLFGTIGIGGVLGGIFGTGVVSKFAKTLAIYQMLCISAALLGLCLLLSLFIFRKSDERLSAGTPAPASGEKDEKPKSGENPVMLVLGSPYLRLIAVMMLVLNVVNSNNEWILDKVLSREKLGTEALNEFYGNYFLFQNIITFAIQFFLTARVQRRFGAAGAPLFRAYRRHCWRDYLLRCARFGRDQVA